MRVIGIIGLAGAGKTTVARYLAEQYGYVRIRFADPLKDMLDAAISDREAIDGATKEVPHKLLCWKTAREAMQTLGTEWGRKCIGEDFWVNLWDSRVEAHEIVGNAGVVADDVRFHNEVGAIYKYGGIIVKVTRLDLELNADVAAHESEKYANEFPYDVHLINDSDIQSLLRKVDYRVARHWSEEKAA